MNNETLGLLFTTTQIGIFSTRFKAFETEFTAKTSLRTFLTIYMALIHVKIPTSWSCQNSIKSVLYFLTRSPHRVEQLYFLLRREPTVRSTENLERRCSLSLSLKLKMTSHCRFLFQLLPILSSKWRRQYYSRFCLIIIKLSFNSHHVPSSRFLTLGTI